MKGVYMPIAVKNPEMASMMNVIDLRSERSNIVAKARRTASGKIVNFFFFSSSMSL